MPKRYERKRERKRKRERERFRRIREKEEIQEKDRVRPRKKKRERTRVYAERKKEKESSKEISFACHKKQGVTESSFRKIELYRRREIVGLLYVEQNGKLQEIKRQ